jgi:hypothetical protein
MADKLKNVLSRKDIFRLADWVRARKGNFENMSLEEVICNCKKELGMEVTASNIRRVAKDLDLQLKVKGESNGRGVHGIAATHKKISQLQRMVKFLYEKLGEAMPEQFE